MPETIAYNHRTPAQYTACQEFLTCAFGTAQTERVGTVLPVVLLRMCQFSCWQPCILSAKPTTEHQNTGMMPLPISSVGEFISEIARDDNATPSLPRYQG